MDTDIANADISLSGTDANYFNLSKNLSYLIGMGTAICGVTAIIATSSIINPKKNEISYAVSIVTIFGLITVLTYPYISELLFRNDDILAGIFLGASIHDTAQVSAAGMIYDCLLYTSPSPRDTSSSRMPSSA